MTEDRLGFPAGIYHESNEYDYGLCKDDYYVTGIPHVYLKAEKTCFTAPITILRELKQ